MNKLFKHKELEQELADAKLAQINMQITQHKEQSQQEKTQVHYKNGGVIKFCLTKTTLLPESQENYKIQAHYKNWGFYWFLGVLQYPFFLPEFHLLKHPIQSNLDFYSA